MHNLLYNLFRHTAIVPHSALKLTKSEKRLIKSFATGPRVFVNTDDERPSELYVMGDNGLHIFNIAMDQPASELTLIN